MDDNAIMTINSLWLSGVIWHQTPWLLLVQVMAFGTKPLTKPTPISMFYYTNKTPTIFIQEYTFEICCWQNMGHFGLASFSKKTIFSLKKKKNKSEW